MPVDGLVFDTTLTWLLRAGDEAELLRALYKRSPRFERNGFVPRGPRGADRLFNE